VYKVRGGEFFVLLDDANIVGSVAVRQFSESVAELKRLNIHPSYRSKGFGTQLCNAALTHAKSAGFRAIRLDTLRRLGYAPHLFRKFGFIEIPRYNENPVADVFMELNLLHGETVQLA